MKTIFLFLTLLFLGIILGGVLHVWKSKQVDAITVSVKKEVPFSIEEPPKKSEKGLMRAMEGEVKWESRVATEPAQIVKPVTIQQGEALLTGDDGKVDIQYENGLEISLSPNSHISFIQILPVNYVVSQLKGSIDYRVKKSTPLAIRTLHLLTQINDGDASIIVDQDTEIITIIVERGSVDIAFNDAQQLSNVITLNQGDEYVFDDTSREGEINTKR